MPIPMDLFTDEPKPEHFDAVETYLSLRLDERTARRVRDRFERAELTTRRVNDILRACSRDPLPLSDPGVNHCLLKAIDGRQFRPVMLVRLHGGGCEIADGYHRVSFAYHVDPFMNIPCLLVSTTTEDK